jgi:uncharacterized protein
MNARLAPVTESQRIDSLDVLRGFAVLGILAMNIQSFSMISATYFNPTAFGDLAGANGWVWRLTHILVDMKFMAIFSMLFGAGIVLMTERADSSGRSPTAVHYRRMAWLILFGLLHAHLLWYGDILYWYGMCGLVVYLFRRLRPRWLFIWGLSSLAITSGLMASAGWSMQFWPPEVMEQFTLDWQPTAEMVAAEVAAYRGGWLEHMSYRVPEALELETSVFLFWAGWRVGGLMLLGMALFKLGVFSARRSPGLYRTLIAIAFLIGIPVILYGMQRNFASGWDARYSFFYGQQFNYWASILVALGWVSLVMLVCQKPRLAPLTRPFAAAGRMAFTNYIVQTIICTAIFYGHGFGLYGQVERSGQVAIVVAVWVFQLVVSPIWLRHFMFGPLEWLWRSLTYWRRQPFRRRVPAAAG